MLVNIFLIILAIIVIAGIIRAIVKENDGFWDFVIDMFWIDTLGDILSWIFEQFSDNDWD